GRTTWGFDLAIWSSHNGNDSIFYTFCREAARGSLSRAAGSIARAASDGIPSPSSLSRAATEGAPPSHSTFSPAWNHYRVTLPDAIESGLVEKINQVRGT